MTPHKGSIGRRPNTHGACGASQGSANNVLYIRDSYVTLTQEVLHNMGFGKDGKGAIIREVGAITLGALGPGTTIKASSQISPEEDFRILKTEVFTHVEGGTADDVCLFGIANDELDVGQIAEAINADGPVDRNDREKTEQAERAVFVLAISELESGSGHLVGMDGQEGVIVHKKPWTYSNDEGWTFWAHNLNGASAMTTGTVIRFYAVHYGVWVT